jgi:hypothetical protein
MNSSYGTFTLLVFGHGERPDLLLVVIERGRALLVLDVPDLDEPVTVEPFRFHLRKDVRGTLELGPAGRFPYARYAARDLIDGTELDAPDASLVALERAEQGERSRRRSRFRHCPERQTARVGFSRPDCQVVCGLVHRRDEIDSGVFTQVKSERFHSLTVRSPEAVART